MRTPRFILFFLLAGLPAASQAEVSGANVPASAVWYFHADFEQMRTGDAGKSLYDWIDGEVFEELREEAGLDVGKEANQVTAFAAPDDGIVMVLDGSVSQTSKDKILAMAVLNGDMETLEAGGKKYYFIADDDADGGAGHRSEMNIGSLENAAYFSFSLKNKIVLTSSKDRMLSLLANNGKIEPPKSAKGSLFVLSADRALIQAGANADEFSDDEDWDSNILKNAKEIALLITDNGEKIGIEAQLVTAKPEMANSLASIARGLISLQVFNDDIEPKISELLQNTSVDVDGSSLRLKIAVDPDVVIETIEN